jgi:hypothetical protein
VTGDSFTERRVFNSQQGRNLTWSPRAYWFRGAQNKWTNGFPNGKGACGKSWSLASFYNRSLKCVEVWLHFRYTLLWRDAVESKIIFSLNTSFIHVMETQEQFSLESLALLPRLLEIVWNLKTCKSQRLLGWLFGGNRMVIVSPVRLFGKYSYIYISTFLSLHRLPFRSVKQCAKPRTQNCLCTYLHMM